MIFLQLQAEVYASISRGDKKFDLFAHAMRQAGAPKGVKFLREDEDYIICKDAGGGINLGVHSHLGINGGKGSLVGLARTGRKLIVGHGHSASIVDGAMMVGTMASLDQGYNKGFSSWSQTAAAIYQNGKRSLVTFYNGAWRAE